MMEIVKVRKSGNCVIITLPKAILQVSMLETGDRVVLEADNPGMVIIMKESEYSREIEKYAK